MRVVVRFVAVCAVSPAMVLGPCYGEVMISLPTGIGGSTSASLLPDRSARREVEGQVQEQGNIAWAPVVSPWTWSDLDPAWQPLGELDGPPQSFLAFWETSSSFLVSNSVEPLMPMLLQAEVPVQGGEMAQAAEIDPDLAPGEQNEEGWAPDAAEGAPAAAAADPAVSQGPINPVLAAQMVGECTVMGEVSDKTTLDPIVGAIVTIGGTGREAETDAQGRFRVDGLPQGTYLVEALKLGYSMGSASASPRPEAPADIRIALTAKPSDTSDGEFILAEEVVVGEYNEESQGDFNLDLGDSMSLTSGLSAEDFAKENVSDAGEALAKVSGANVVGGKFAVVRGLSDRYIGTTFNGAQLASAVSDRKAIELDLFPTSAIQAIDVAKTYRPDLLGDFGGAAIDLQSRNFPDEPIAFAKVKAKYDGSLPNRFLQVPGKSLRYLGTTSNWLNPAKFTETDPVTGRVRLVTSPAAQALPVWQSLEATRSPYPTFGDPSQEYSYGLGFGDTIEVTDYLDLGLLFGHGWKSGSDYNQSDERRAPERSWQQEDFTNFTEWDLYIAASARLNDDHEISAIFFRKHIAETNVTSATNLRDPNIGFEYGNDSIQNLQGTRPFYGADAEQLGGFFELKPLERDLRIIQLSGKNRLGERGVRMRWSFTDSDARELQPNTTFQEFTTLDFDSPALDRAQAAGEAFITKSAEGALGLPPGSLTFDEARQAFIDNGAAAFLAQLESQRLPVRDPSLGRIDTLAVSRFTGAVGPGNLLTRATQSVRESTTDSNIGFEIPWYFSEENEDRGFELGLGASRIERTRSSRGSLFELVYENLNASGTSQGGFDRDDFYPSGDSDGDGLSNLGELLFGSGSIAEFFTGTRNGAPYYQDGSIGTDNFLGLIANNADANHDFNSWYLSGNLFFGDTFIRGGLRHEAEERVARFLEPKPIGEQDPAPITEEVWLPSVSGGTSVFDGKLTLFAAWSRTVARPTFFEWVPVRSFDLSTGFIRAGNPDLINSTVSNFDFAVEFNPVENRTFRVSLFNKEILDPIVGVRVPGVADAIGFINGDKGTISGVEFEAELREIGPFTLRSNITYIDASLDYTFNTGQPVSVNFPYQPNWIANLNLGYDKEEWDFGVNLIYNFTGEYATLLRTTPNFPDVIRESQQSLDLVLRKGFEIEGGGKLGITLGIENLVGTDEVFRFSGGNEAVDGRIRSQLQRDRLYFAELKYDF